MFVSRLLVVPGLVPGLVFGLVFVFLGTLMQARSAGEDFVPFRGLRLRVKFPSKYRKDLNRFPCGLRSTSTKPGGRELATVTRRLLNRREEPTAAQNRVLWYPFPRLNETNRILFGSCLLFF